MVAEEGKPPARSEAAVPLIACPHAAAVWRRESEYFFRLRGMALPGPPCGPGVRSTVAKAGRLESRCRHDGFVYTEITRPLSNKLQNTMDGQSFLPPRCSTSRCSYPLRTACAARKAFASRYRATRVLRRRDRFQRGVAPRARRTYVRMHLVPRESTPTRWDRTSRTSRKVVPFSLEFGHVKKANRGTPGPGHACPLCVRPTACKRMQHAAAMCLPRGRVAIYPNSRRGTEPHIVSCSELALAVLV